MLPRRQPSPPWAVEGQPPVVCAALGPSHRRVQAVRPGRIRHGSEPAVIGAELPRQVIIDRQVGPSVVAHDQAPLGVVGVVPGVAADEAAVGVAELVGHGRAVVRRVLVGLQRSGRPVVDGVGDALVGIGQPRGQPVDVGAPLLQRQGAEDVVGRSVLHHEHDEVVDLR
jgi:hypothetical protein